MAGYIFNLDNLESLKLYAQKGIYGTKLSEPDGYWRIHHEGTFADYITMKPGDNVYFFIERKIYGIGKLVKLGDDCKYFNFPEAGSPQVFKYSKLKKELLLDEGEFSINQRFVCFFQPDPYFFLNGVDMDDVLSSRPQAFKMLRAFWKVSFIKFDDEENQAFKDILLKSNEDAIKKPEIDLNIINSEFNTSHKSITNKLKTNNYKINVAKILSSCSNSTGSLGHEMALELGSLYQLSSNHPLTIKIFGKYDYLSHQVIASPFKPIDYMDKMDIFGYSFITGFEPTKSKYIVIELKKDTAKTADLDQIMKYVDWINHEYSFGDYNMIKAFLVAHDFEEDVIKSLKDIGTRKYTLGMKPSRSMEWSDVNLVKYSFNNDLKVIDFNLIE